MKENYFGIESRGDTKPGLFQQETPEGGMDSVEDILDSAINRDALEGSIQDELGAEIPLSDVKNTELLTVLGRLASPIQEALIDIDELVELFRDDLDASDGEIAEALRIHSGLHLHEAMAIINDKLFS